MCVQAFLHTRYSHMLCIDSDIEFDAASNNNSVIKITNTLGQTIKTIELGNVSGQQNVSLNISDLEKGIYMVQIISGENNIVKQIVLK